MRSSLKSFFRISQDETVVAALKASAARLFVAFSNQYLAKLKDRYVNKKLKDYRLSSDKQVLFIYSYLAYDHPMKQRPQHIADSVSSLGYTVIYITPQQARVDFVFGIKQINKSLYVSDCLKALLKHFRQSYTLIYSIDLRLSWEFYDMLLQNNTTVIYDYMDLLDEEHFLKTLSDPQKFLDLQEHILKSPDSIVLASSDLIFNKSKEHRKIAHLIPNACNPNDFITNRSFEDINAKMKDIIQLNKAIIGFVGALACWIDYDLIEKIAYQNQNLSFVFIGPNLDGSSEYLKNKNLPNLFFLGTVGFAKLKHYTAWFDASLVPFRVVELTNAVSPVKLFEYMAIGKPIIATKTEEIKKYKSVLLIDDAEDFSEKISSYLDKKHDKNYQKLVTKELSENTWNNRAKKILDILNKHDRKK